MFMISVFKSTATAAIGIHPTKADGELQKKKNSLDVRIL